MLVKIIGSDGVNWSIDKDRRNLEYFLSKMNQLKISSSFFLSRIYFFVWYSQLVSIAANKVFFLRTFKKIFGKKFIAVATNDIRSHPDNFNKIKSLVDIWISPNSKISSFFQQQNSDFVQIPFYVSPKNFYPMNLKKSDIFKKLNLVCGNHKDKILIGSFQRDSLGEDLAKPKWQKNPDLLIEILRELRTGQVILILAGPRRHYIINQCKKYKIPYLFVGEEKYIDNHLDDIRVNNLSEEKINLLNNLIDIYIVTSKSEGGPKAILESALSKTLIFSTDVGLAKDFIHPDLIYSENEIDRITKFISNYEVKRDAVESYVDFNYEKTHSSLNDKNYLKLYDQLVDKIT